MYVRTTSLGVRNLAYAILANHMYLTFFFYVGFGAHLNGS